MNDANRAALAALARPPWLATRFELLPIRGMREAAAALPAGAVVTVTCSPRHGLERTLEASEWLVGAGFQAVPHLAARLMRDRHHLERLLAQLAALGIEDVFVVGGDAERPVGDFPHGLALLEAMAALSTRPERVGVPAYPEGHHRIAAAPPCSATSRPRRRWPTMPSPSSASRRRPCWPGGTGSGASVCPCRSTPASLA